MKQEQELEALIAKISLIVFVILLLLTTFLLTIAGGYVIWLGVTGIIVIPALIVGTDRQRWLAGFGILLILLLMMSDYTSGQDIMRNLYHARLDAVSRKVKELESQLEKYKSEEEILQKTIFKPGFMYWSGPSLLASDWAAVITGTVVSVEKYDKTPYLTLCRGKIKIDQVLFSRPTKKGAFVKTDYLACDGGFKGLKAGDKVMVFLVEYEDGYAIADYVGGTCQLGLKLSSFNAPIVDAVKDRLSTGHISDKYQKIWRDIDPKSFDSNMKKLVVKKK